MADQNVPQSKTGLSDEIIAFANSAKVAQQLLNEDTMAPMAIKEFTFNVSYEFGETYKEGLEIGFAVWTAKTKITAQYENNTSTKLTIACTLIPIMELAPSVG